ncbi:uncharacterized protein [Amphiura filiformis]|uniref:uncharacterized protein n=1 Tax=Amphiura filiformis TaxID=82378 RepID=UPI003B223EB9
MDTNGKSHPQRVFLWSVPRSLSTVFGKCMSFIPKTQIVNEPFNCAYHMGPEMQQNDSKPVSDDEVAKYEKGLADKINEMKHELPMAFDAKVCTYNFVKSELEADYPGKELVFCKDMAYGLVGKYDMLPEGYRHTFIIRNPYRMFPSHRKLLAKILEGMGVKKFRLCDLPPTMLPKGYAFQEQYELMLYVQENCGQDPIIIDADDLLSNPASIMCQYCELLGIPFQEEMLEWPSGLDVIKSWKGSREILVGNLLETGGYYDTALKSTRYHQPKKMPKREELAEDTLVCVDHSMPFYEKMYDLRLKP